MRISAQKILGLFSVTCLLSTAAWCESKVVVRFAKPVCGDCCIDKSLSAGPGILTLENVRVGATDVTFVYDETVTTPEQIIANLAKVGKKAAVVPSVNNVSSLSNQKAGATWVSPRRKK